MDVKTFEQLSPQKPGRWHCLAKQDTRFLGDDQLGIFQKEAIKK
jgi:hypothetical protein